MWGNQKRRDKIYAKFKYAMLEYVYRSFYLDVIFLRRVKSIRLAGKLLFIFTKYYLILKHFIFIRFELSKSKAKMPRLSDNLSIRDFYYNHAIATTGGLQAAFSEHIVWFKSLNLPTEPVFVDVGANVGNVSFAFKSTWENAKIFCIEPSEINFKTLRLNMNNNEFKDTHLINQAVSNSEKNSIYLMKNLKEGALNKSISNISDIPYDLNGNVVDEVKNSKLDTVLSKFHLDRVDILKIDVEGFELEVLESAREVLQKTRYLHIELNFDDYKISDFFRILSTFEISCQLLNCRIFGFGNTAKMGDFLFELAPIQNKVKGTLV
jgi:FkbM family methyltransferase